MPITRERYPQHGFCAVGFLSEQIGPLWLASPIPLHNCWQIYTNLPGKLLLNGPIIRTARGLNLKWRPDGTVS